MKDIILIGMPGSGKSTVGVVLAKRLGFHFVDSDLVIQEQSKKLLYQIIAEKGAEGFWKIENAVNLTLPGENQVIATGGSAIYGREAMESFQEKGIVVYLKLSLPTITQRLGDLNERGVTLKVNQTLADLYNERIPYYEKYASEILDCEEKDIREITEEITKIVRKREDA